MCKDDSVSDGVAKPKKPVPKGLTPFTAMTAKQAQEASVRARNLRKQARSEMLNKVVQNYDFGDELLKALKKGDMDKVALLKEAMALIGLKYEQSEEFVNRMQIDATTDNKTALSGQIEFVVPQKN
jgi:hypothetical protein